MRLSANVRKLRVTFCQRDDDLPSLSTPGGELASWQEFFSKRNEVLAALRPFGSVGPMGEAPITDDPEGPPDQWPVEATEPEYFVVDDQLNDNSRYHYVEVQQARHISGRVLQSLWDVVRRDPRWSVGIGVPKERYVFISKAGIWTRGKPVRGCRTVDDVIAACEGGV